MNLLWKLMLNVLVVITFFRSLNSWKSLLKVAIDDQWNSRRKESVYKKERIITESSVFLFLKISLRGWHVDWWLKFVGFLGDIMEDDKNNDRMFLKIN